MSELLDKEMTGVSLETKWIDKVGWFFVVWSAAYLTGYFILQGEPSLVHFPPTYTFGEPHFPKGSRMVEIAGDIARNYEKILAVYLGLNLLVMVLAFGLTKRAKAVRWPFIIMLYLTIIFHLLKWLVLVVYIKVYNLEFIPEGEEFSMFRQVSQLFLYLYTGYIILLWFAFRWVSRRLQAPEILADFSGKNPDNGQPR